MKPSKEKRAEAVERNEHWSSMSLAKQIKDLDQRLGVGVGAVKQRAKIAKRQEEAKGSCK